MNTLTLVLIVLGCIVLTGLLAIAVGFYSFFRHYSHLVIRVFEEKPLFKKPVVETHPEGEDHEVTTPSGLKLTACHIRSHTSERKGLILFAPEFGGCRWSCQKYAGSLLDAGYDLFSFDFRNQGGSESMETYYPMQWVTNHEIEDVQAVINYIKAMPDAPESIGIMGVSRGGGAVIVAAAANPYVKCVVTDGAFGTVATMVPFMKKWIGIFVKHGYRHVLPGWFFSALSWCTLNMVRKRRQLSFPSVRNALSRLKRPLFMIHGEADNYIPPETALALHKKAPKDTELWMVEGAKHNQSIKVKPEVYKGRICMFFDHHLAQMTEPVSVPSRDLVLSD